MSIGEDHLSAANSVELPGRVLLPGGIERDCVLRYAADGTIWIIPAVAENNSRVICHAEGIGVIEGIATYPASDGQELQVQATAHHRARLAARISWHRRKAAGLDDQRAHDRVVPTITEVTVRNAEGEEMSGTLLDISATGAALLLPTLPEVGSALVIGRRHARVVRHIDGGVAVAFNLPLRPQDVVPETIL